jgi:hypothetical protein
VHSLAPAIPLRETHQRPPQQPHAYVITAISAGRLGATRASDTAYFIPVVALVLGVLVRGEHVAALSVIGSGVLLAGAWVMRRAQEVRVERQPGTAALSGSAA